MNSKWEEEEEEEKQKTYLSDLFLEYGVVLSYSAFEITGHCDGGNKSLLFVWIADVANSKRPLLFTV